MRSRRTRMKDQPLLDFWTEHRQWRKPILNSNNKDVFVLWFNSHALLLRKEHHKITTIVTTKKVGLHVYRQLSMRVVHAFLCHIRSDVIPFSCSCREKVQVMWTKVCLRSGSILGLGVHRPAVILQLDKTGISKNGNSVHSVKMTACWWVGHSTGDRWPQKLLDSACLWQNKLKFHFWYPYFSNCSLILTPRRCSHRTQSSTQPRKRQTQTMGTFVAHWSVHTPRRQAS